MFRISNIRIGTKLSIMSGVGILLVIGMIGGSLHGNSVVKVATEAATYQPDLARATDLESVGRQNANGRKKTYGSPTLPRAFKRHSNISTLGTQVLLVYRRELDKVQTPKPRATSKAKILTEQYFSGTKEIAALKTEIIALKPSGQIAMPAILLSVSLRSTSRQTVWRARRTLPIATELEDLTGKTAEASGCCDNRRGQR
jgi:methyl-accepting chemotaxis protein